MSATKTDDIYDEAVEWVRANLIEVGVSDLQRRFRIGYARASGLVCSMLDRDVVQPSDTAFRYTVRDTGTTT